MMLNKVLYLIRGVSGAGKSTFAKQLMVDVVAVDDFFVDSDGNYKFNSKLLPDAHEWCRRKVEDYLKRDESVAVANTFTQEWEMYPYLDMADDYGYTVFSIIVENRHRGKNVHGVPDNVLANQRKRFEVSL